MRAFSCGPRKHLGLVWLSVVAAAAILAATAAGAGFSPGTYHAKGGVSFTFQIKRDTCVAVHNVGSPKAKVGKARPGLCYRDSADPPVKMRCPSGYSLSGEQALISVSHTGVRFSPSGLVHFRSYSYSSGADPVGHSELEIQLHGRTASGFVEVVAQVGNGTVTCDSGKLKFTARLR